MKGAQRENFYCGLYWVLVNLLILTFVGAVTCVALGTKREIPPLQYAGGALFAFFGIIGMNFMISGAMHMDTYAYETPGFWRLQFVTWNLIAVSFVFAVAMVTVGGVYLWPGVACFVLIPILLVNYIACLCCFIDFREVVRSERINKR